MPLAKIFLFPKGDVFRDLRAVTAEPVTTDRARALAFDVLVAALKLWISASPSDDPDWVAIRSELRALENRRSSLALETSAPIDPKSEWFPVLVNAIHVHMLLLNSVYCDIVQPIDIDPHVRAKMLGLLFPARGGEVHGAGPSKARGLDRSSAAYLPEHDSEPESEGRAQGRRTRTRYEHILGEDDAHAESHAPSTERPDVGWPGEGAARQASAAGPAPGSTGRSQSTASIPGEPRGDMSEAERDDEHREDDWDVSLPESLLSRIGAAPQTQPELDAYFLAAVDEIWEAQAARSRARAVYFDQPGDPSSATLDIDTFELVGAFAAEMRVLREKASRLGG